MSNVSHDEVTEVVDSGNVRTKHKAMVKLLVKPGTAIQETLTPEKVNALHAAVGVAGEAGELLDAIKKHVVYNKELDITNVIEELGDLEFYMEQLRQEFGISRIDTLAYNYVKLMKKRYPNGYTDAAAQERADKVPEPEQVVTGTPLTPERLKELEGTSFVGCKTEEEVTALHFEWMS